jgi:uncharacterized membrane protein YgcG
MKKLILTAIASLLISVAFAQQQERIIRFHSDIKIETDGRIEVAEHIKVYAGGKDIKRGIVRELPLYREDNKGKRVRMHYTVLAVQCNGEDVKHRFANEDDHLVIYIGDARVRLEAGEYDYTVVYESWGQIGFFDDYDELYWNVTGNGWVFPIEQASAAITLPDNSTGKHTDCYTGAKGATGKDCSVEDRGNVQIFTTTSQLAPREGLTVAVAFPRDVISRPTTFSQLKMFLSRNRSDVYGCATGLIFLLFFAITLRTIGKHPFKPTVIPTFKPPRNISPASLRYLHHTVHFLDNNYSFLPTDRSKLFTATLVEMAVKGSMAIRCDKKNENTSTDYTLVNKMNTEQLRPEEQEIHATIFAGTDSNSCETEVEVNSKNYAKFSTASDVLHKSLIGQWEPTDYFRKNRLWVVIGGLILNAVFALYLFITGGTDDVIWALMVASPLIAYELAIIMGGWGIAIGLVGAFATLVTLIFLRMEDLVWTCNWVSVVFVSALSLLYAYYSKRLKILTPEGAKIDSEIAGFKMYMATAEEHRLNMLNPPDKTPELFEKLLPYAMAFGFDNNWCKRFDSVLMQAGYHPQWYNSDDGLSGKDIFDKEIADRLEELSKSFTIIVHSTQSNSAGSSKGFGGFWSSGSSDWSSGSSGGGYSGGGGGGGGGRGW